MSNESHKSSCCVSYLRVSTDRQGIGGLGVEAQRETVRQWAIQHGATIAAEYVEAESGRNTKRPELDRARDHAKRAGCILVVAKLDRLTRNVAFLHKLLEERVPIVFCDLPQSNGPQGEFLISILASVAALEAKMISQRTKAALSAAKARGTKLGNPNGAAALLRYHAARRASGGAHPGTEAAKVRAAVNEAEALGMIREVQGEGFTSQRQIADELNRRGWLTPSQGRWHQTTVARLVGG